MKWYSSQTRAIKLYERLETEKKVAVALHWISQLDDVEIDRVRRSIKTPGELEVCLHEITAWMDIFQVWESKYLRELYEYQKAVNQISQAKRKKAMAEARQRTARITALFSALEKVCSAHSVSVDDAMRIVNVPVIDWMVDSPLIDSEYAAEVAGELLAVLTMET